MLDHLWAGMILAGILWAAFHGRLSDVTLGMLDGAADAVSLGVTMLGVLSFWSWLGRWDRCSASYSPVWIRSIRLCGT